MSEQLLSQRYRVIRALGAGGMGHTYLAEDTHMPGSPQCVVKHLKPASQESAVVTTAKRLFYREAETLQQLGEHDRIPRLLAYFEQWGEFYLVQEYIDGHPLTQELRLGERWSQAQAIELLREILEILVVVHGQGVIHRDIKPDNIMRRKHDGKLVLIDFGAVKQIHLQQPPSMQSRTSVTVVVGTMGYMPMEQARGKPRACSDLYAAGMIAIQALTGLLPLQLQENEDGEVIWQDQARIDATFKTILAKMTRHYFKQRYQTAAEVLAVLQPLTKPASRPVGQALPPPSRTPTTIAPWPKPYPSTNVLAASSLTSSTTQQPSERARIAPQSKRWLMGFGAAALVTGVLSAAIATYLSWHENAFAKSIDEIGALLDRGDYGACINKANALQQQTSFLVTIKSSIQKEPPAKNSLTNLLADCQLKQGGMLAEAGQYEGAIRLIDSIDTGARAYGEAQEFKKSLLEVLQVLQTDEELYLQATDAFETGAWGDVVAISNRIVSGQWKEKVEPLRYQAATKIEAQVAAERVKQEQERQEQLKQERERLARAERERLERERIEQQRERERLEREKKEREAWCSRNSGC